MKSFLPMLVLGLMPAFGQAQVTTSPAASASPQPSAATPVRRPPTLVSSMAPRVPPTQPETRDPRWEARANANTAKASADAANIEVVFDGDSITDGWQGAGRKVWSEAFGKDHPFDFGISGDTTQNLLWRLAHGQGQGLHPKVILLMIGTNDMHFTSTPQEIADGVNTIIQQYRKLCPDAVIVLQAIFPRGATSADPYRLKVNATNACLAKLDDGSKVIYLDFGAKFLTADGTLSKEIMGDLLHPTPKGYQIWADSIAPTLAKYIPAGAPQ